MFEGNIGQGCVLWSPGSLERLIEESIANRIIEEGKKKLQKKGKNIESK